jgi:hypothetical protein
MLAVLIFRGSPCLTQSPLQLRSWQNAETVCNHTLLSGTSETIVGAFQAEANIAYFEIALPLAQPGSPPSLRLYSRPYCKGAVHADEAGSWDKLHERFEVKRINHQEACSLDAACTNQAEKYFSCLRRTEIGGHHHIAGAYLLRYAQESSWREDNRRVSKMPALQRSAGYGPFLHNLHCRCYLTGDIARASRFLPSGLWRLPPGGRARSTPEVRPFVGRWSGHRVHVRRRNRPVHDEEIGRRRHHADRCTDYQCRHK